jgi:hypothetical protein
MGTTEDPQVRRTYYVLLQVLFGLEEECVTPGNVTQYFSMPMNHARALNQMSLYYAALYRLFASLHDLATAHTTFPQRLILTCLLSAQGESCFTC